MTDEEWSLKDKRILVEVDGDFYGSRVEKVDDEGEYVRYIEIETLRQKLIKDFKIEPPNFDDDTTLFSTRQIIQIINKRFGVE